MAHHLSSACIRLLRQTAAPILVLCATLLIAGCDAGPDLGHDRDQVRELQRHHANDMARHQATRLGDDDARLIRYTLAKSAVTAADAANLPVGSVKILKAALADRRLRRYGPNIVKLLGMIGGEAEFRFLRDYLENDVSGSIDEYTYRTLLAVPEAIGYIAIHNDRAYATLRTYLRVQYWRQNIQWRFMLDDREINAYRLTLAALDGIAISGRRDAIPFVQFIVDYQNKTPGTHVAHARTLMDDRLETHARRTVDILARAK